MACLHSLWPTVLRMRRHNSQSSVVAGSQDSGACSYSGVGNVPELLLYELRLSVASFGNASLAIIYLAILDTYVLPISQKADLST